MLCHSLKAYLWSECCYVVFVFSLLNQSSKTWVLVFKSLRPEVNKTANSPHKKWSFPLRISPVNVTKSAGNCDCAVIFAIISFNTSCWRNMAYRTPWSITAMTFLEPFREMFVFGTYSSDAPTLQLHILFLESSLEIANKQSYIEDPLYQYIL